ncbi:MAG: GNAT family N-acetyltransferase [Pseudomonadota bacterium]
MNYTITLGDWLAQRPDARAVRHEVFIVEQNIPVSLEWDEMDDVSLHAVAFDDQHRAIGTGRLLPDGHIGRMAVSETWRGKGVGAAILLALIDAAAGRGDSVVMLSAQIHAAAFYEHYGFVREGAEYMEAGIPHVHMQRSTSLT